MQPRKREPSQHARSDAELVEQVKVTFQVNRGRYGSPRVHAELRAQGVCCSRKRVARLMREQELFAKRPRHRTITTQSDPEAQMAPNLLQRDFSADQPDRKWVADTTYIWTAEGWLFLAVVLDLCSRMVARLVHGCHPGCWTRCPSTAHGHRSSPSAGWLTSSYGSWEHLHEPEVSSSFATRGHDSQYEPHG
jgi:hypothetical protein